MRKPARARRPSQEGVGPAESSAVAMLNAGGLMESSVRAFPVGEATRALGNRQVSRLLGERIMRAEMPAEETELASVNARAAPLPVLEQPFPTGVGGFGAALAWGGWLLGGGANSVGELAAGERVRTLERRGTQARIHVETGAHRGKIGWVPLGAITSSAAPTSQREPTAGPENAYTQLQTELATVPPSRSTILFIIQTRLTMAQHRQLLAPGNAEWAALMGMAAITAEDIVHILQVLGARLPRKLNDYLTKGGTNLEELRLALATSTDNERREVARDDALVGRLRPLLATVHPEIAFGPALADLYPADGKLSTLRPTNPELARWLQGHVRPGTNLNTAAAARGRRLERALAAITSQGARRARPAVMGAVQAAARGAALPESERTALDAIEEAAYNEGAYTAREMGAMFVTRWGRPFRDAANQPKTFLHRIWKALKPLPMEHVLLNNVLGYFGLNTNPLAAGSFTDFLSSPNYGRLVSDPPSPETLHAVNAQSGRTIAVLEPTLDLMGPGQAVAVQQADGTTANVQVDSVDVARRRVRLNAPVTVAAGGELRPPQATPATEAAAMRITAPAAFYADVGGTPDTSTVVATIEPGNQFGQQQTAVVGGTTYIGGTVITGSQRNVFGWIDQSQATGLGQTVEQARFEKVARHEMGHALDLQLNGYSRFSGPSAAGWRKYTGVNDWLNDLIGTASIATPDTAQTYSGITDTFRNAAATYARAVQNRPTLANPGPTNAQTWLQGWVAAGGSQDVYDVITQFNATRTYYNQNNVGLPPLGGRIFGAHYNEFMSANAEARTESIAVGVPTYAYTCTYEFFADHYAAYTAAGLGGETYARSVPEWAKNFFDRLVGAADAGPRAGMDRHRMGA